MYKQEPVSKGHLLKAMPKATYAAIFLSILAIPWIILSVGAINALIPIVIIIILIAAAAGSTRNFSFFNVFGISQLLSGMGSYGGASRGSMAKSGYGMRAYLDPFIRYKSKYKNKGGKNDYESKRRGILGGILAQARVLRGRKGPASESNSRNGSSSSKSLGTQPGSSAAKTPSANILKPQTLAGSTISAIKGTATRLNLMKGPKGSKEAPIAKNTGKEKKTPNSGTFFRYATPILWGVSKSIHDTYRTYKPKLPDSEKKEENAPTPRPYVEQAALRTLIYGEEGKEIKSRQESIEAKKEKLKSLEDSYNKKYNTSDLLLAFTPLLSKTLDPLQASPGQRLNSRNAWKELTQIQNLRRQIHVEEAESEREPAGNLYTGHMEAALSDLEWSKTTLEKELKNMDKARRPNAYEELQSTIKDVDSKIKEGKNLKDIAPIMYENVKERLEEIEKYTGRPSSQAESQKEPASEDKQYSPQPAKQASSQEELQKETASPSLQETAQQESASPGVLSELKEKYEKGEITGNQFDRAYVRIYNKLYGPIDKSITHHLTNPYYSNYLTGLGRTSSATTYAENINSYIKSAEDIVKKTQKRIAASIWGNPENPIEL